MTDNPFNIHEFREELSDMLDEKFKLIVKPIVDMQTADHTLIQAHEAALQRSRGVMWVLGILWGALMTILGIHIGKHP